MNRQEKSLLLYLETRVVDKSGIIDYQHLNDDDWEILEGWSRAGFVKAGKADDVDDSPSAHYVILSVEAHKTAALLRVMRADRWLARSKRIPAAAKKGEPVGDFTYAELGGGS